MMLGRALCRSLPVIACVLVSIVSQLAGSSAVASTVVPMNASTLAGHAGQVIVGEVASVRSYWADAPRRIETRVFFEKVTYLKGRLADSTERFSLVVPGGTVGEMRMRVCGAPEFRPGERHVLFLLPSYKTFPTVGLWQGAFRLIPDADGVGRVYQQGVAVTGFDAEGFVRFASGARPSAHEHLIAGDRARLAAPLPSPATASAEAMRYEDLAAYLKPILEASRDHKLTEPAGKRVRVELRPVPLRVAPAARHGGQRRAEGGEDRERKVDSRSAKQQAGGDPSPRERTDRPALKRSQLDANGGDK